MNGFCWSAAQRACSVQRASPAALHVAPRFWAMRTQTSPRSTQHSPSRGPSTDLEDGTFRGGTSHTPSHVLGRALDAKPAHQATPSQHQALTDIVELVGRVAIAPLRATACSASISVCSTARLTSSYTWRAAQHYGWHTAPLPWAARFANLAQACLHNPGHNNGPCEC